jgi:hypothetical protein
MLKYKLRQLLSELKGLMSMATWSFVFYALRRRPFRPEPEKSKKIVLIEFTYMTGSIICIWLLIRVLREKYRGAVFLSFSFDPTSSRLWEKRLLYWAIGAPLTIFDQRAFQEVAEKKTAEILGRGLNKRGLLNLAIDDIQIGDLIYDEHLNRNRIPTVDLRSAAIAETIQAALTRFYFLQEYFNTNQVVATYNTHQCYFEAIPLRISASRNIEVFSVHETEIQRFSQEKLWHTVDTFKYPEVFRRLPEIAREKGRIWASQRIQERFLGKVGVDMRYSTRSAFTEPDHRKKILKQNGKIEILIAAHCFFDAANGSGRNIFPDFYEWLKIVGKVSNQTDFNWYLKTHPDYLPGNDEIAQEIIRDYPRIQWIPNTTSHLQLVEEGLDFALTVYGTIAFEYAALGVTVINASMFNPHVSYQFNLHPRSQEEYEKLLLSLSRDKKIKINLEDIYEYYFMHKYYYDVTNWLIPNYDEYIDQYGYSSTFDRQFFLEFIKVNRKFPEGKEKCFKVLRAFVNGDKDRCTRVDVEGKNWLAKLENQINGTILK